MRKIKEIILHCTATRAAQKLTVADIDRWHRDLGWDCIGYHYVIYQDGSVHEGRPVAMCGAHCKGRNVFSIGVAYVGGVEDDGRTPKDTRTPEQKVALRKLVRELMAKYGLTLDNVYCHNQFAKKACPSFSIDEFKKEMTQEN